jgi:cell volume regulation protein A
MTDTRSFAELLLVVSLSALAAVVSNRLSARVRVPAPAIFLAASAVAVTVIPRLSAPPERTVERVVTVALVFILFDGGAHIGRRRLRETIGPVLSVGVLGTFLTATAAAAVVHLGFGFSWYVAALIGTAVAPTDPAVVFSVLGQREIAGRSGTILESESGANDPVGIALLASLLAAGSVSGGALAHVVGEFTLQLGVGAALGVAGGVALLWFTRRVSLPSEGLYPLRSLACVLALYGAATLAHGSGFLAVFVAGIVVGDERAPFHREVRRFHSALASLGELVAFVALGLTVNLHVLARADVWGRGLVLGVVLAVVIRPLLVGACLLPARLRRGEAGFVLFAGLKGAVPILLGSLLLTGHVPEAPQLYGIIIVVVAFSVVVQGSLVSTVAHAFKVPMRSIEPEPWALGVRLTDEPEGVIRLKVAPGSAAAGQTVAQIANICGAPDDVWMNFLVRDRRLLRVRGDTQLRVDDEVLITADDDHLRQLDQLFTAPPQAE